MTRAVQARIDLSALGSNLQRVRKAAPGCKIMAIVKANAYGHGALQVARSLEGVDSFGVASVDEALYLRSENIKSPIVLLEGFFEESELGVISQEGFEIVVHHVSQVEALESASLPKPVNVWLKIDSGMHRLGFAPGLTGSIWERLKQSRNVVDNIRVMTHLACADDMTSDVTMEQYNLFEMVTEDLGAEKSIANSAGIIGWPVTHKDWVRPGIMLYGASPLIDKSAAQLGLQPVMTLCSRLIAINRCKKGDSVGYGGEWCCPEDMSIGVVAIGYGDGYPRHAAAGTPVLVNGSRARLIGRVSMDMITVDLRTVENARIGDSVVLWGEGLPVDEVAAKAETISYELLCGVAPRVPLQIVD